VREEPWWGEVPDLLVGDAEVEDDLFDALAALERELDLDRRCGVAVEDRVGEVVAVARAGAGLLGECAFALPAAEPELLLDEEADVGDRLDVADKTVVGLPGAEAAAGDRAAAAGEPDERRQVDREPRGLRPAGRTPTIAQAAGGPVAATDQDGELVECDRVLLCDEGEQFLVAFGDLVAAPVPPWCPPCRSLLVDDRVRLFLQLDHSLPVPLPLSSLLVLVCAPAPASFLLGVAAVFRDHPHSDGFLV
jgi:hypothetical protein